MNMQEAMSKWTWEYLNVEEIGPERVAAQVVDAVLDECADDHSTVADLLRATLVGNELEAGLKEKVFPHVVSELIRRLML